MSNDLSVSDIVAIETQISYTLVSEGWGKKEDRIREYLPSTFHTEQGILILAFEDRNASKNAEKDILPFLCYPICNIFI